MQLQNNFSALAPAVSIEKTEVKVGAPLWLWLWLRWLQLEEGKNDLPPAGVLSACESSTLAATWPLHKCLMLKSMFPAIELHVMRHCTSKVIGMNA